MRWNILHRLHSWLLNQHGGTDSWAGLKVSYLIICIFNNRSDPGPHSHRTRGHLCSFPTPYLWERIYPLSRVLVAIGNYKNTTFGAFLWNLHETEAKTPFVEKMETRMRPPLICIRVGVGDLKWTGDYLIETSGCLWTTQPASHDR